MDLYHYTNQAGYNAIVTSGVLLPSTDRVIDATYGEGYYFTDLGPSSCERRIADACWQNKFMTFKVEYYIKFNIPYGLAKWCRSNVYLVTTGTMTNFNVLEKGRKPNCSLKTWTSCEKCSLDPKS
jgi:hypothetical protein